jgi:rhodanese-related sulfurtransferase
LLCGFASEAAEFAVVQLDPRCAACHKPERRKLYGVLENISRQAGYIQVRAGESIHIFKADERTRLENANSPVNLLQNIGNPVSVRYSDDQSIPWAAEITVKPKIELPDDERIKGKDMLGLVKRGPIVENYTLVDVRPEEMFNSGHIPTAISIDEADMDRQVQRLPRDKGSLLIFYCRNNRWATAQSAARKAKAMGYRNVRVYAGGIDDWIRAGRQPALRPAENLAVAIRDDASPIIIDVRPRGETGSGFIPGSVALDPDEMGVARSQFPRDPGVQIVICGARGIDSDTLKALRTIVDWGYGNVSILEGGYEAWESGGHEVSTGRANMLITYRAAPRQGEMSASEFMDIAESTSKNGAVLLDLRPEREAAGARFDSALTVPLSKLPERLGSLPRNREIVAFSSDGRSGEIAYHILRRKGYNVHYLAASLNVSADGSYTIDN